jgi:hypothetical protein
VDVAFHVDMTQERKGYASEVELNAIRAEYIERARGLPLSVFFNTTAYDGNFHEIPAVAAFFVANATWCASRASSSRPIRARHDAGPPPADRHRHRGGAAAGGARAPINFDTPIAGHSECNRYAMTLVANGRVHDLYGDGDALATILETTAGIQFDRQHRGRAVMALARGLARRPGGTLRLVPWALGRLWAMRRDLWAARGRATSCPSSSTTSWMPSTWPASASTPASSWWRRRTGRSPCACTTPSATASSCSPWRWKAAASGTR